ncbi:glycosyltransferase family 4 protein [Alistipes sp.]|uniref:glycosyltransferase family 4 protein n=1 Tax=Alistipes sp. TaxID=1872444 RepID=UPI003AF13AF3
MENTPKKKIALVIIRYGAEVNGGAEVHCRMLAERLLPYYRVEVLTTTMRVFDDPAQDYPEGVQVENGVEVRRFRPAPVDGERFRALRRRSKTVRRIRYYLSKAGLLRPLADRHPRWGWGCTAERRYFEAQKGHTPAMLHFIAEHRDDYAALIFMNYFFSQTVLGSLIAPEKTILIPLAHPDRSLYYSLQTEVFTRVRHIAFNAPAEERLCRGLFGRAMAPGSVLGAGLDPAPESDWAEVRAKYGLPERYVLYLGRITPGKVRTLIPDFLRYAERSGTDAKLVLAGGIDPAFRKTDSPRVLFTGFVSDAEKSALIRHATVMVNPSPHESLSLLMLEALAAGVPALVNGRAEVMKDHCEKSGAAWWYRGKRDFRRKLHRLLTDDGLRRELGAKGPAYVRAHYDWEGIIRKLRGIIDRL